MIAWRGIATLKKEVAMAATPLKIDDPEAFELAREIADRTGTTVTQVVVDALREKKERLPQPKEAVDREKLRAIVARIRALPVVDPRSTDEILADMYDENGLWK
jgi:antitoxin VapB